jgi:hypothetical protein
MKGRLALALVSARAERCANKACGRARRCLARFGPGANYHTPMGSCPNMSAAEWRAVSWGMEAGLMILRPVIEALLEES